MQTKIKEGKKTTVYDVTFNHNVENNISAAVVYRDGKFLHAATVDLTPKATYKVVNGRVKPKCVGSHCRNCGRKEAMALAFSNISRALLPREHKHHIWETYRTITKVPRWPKSKFMSADEKVRLKEQKAMADAKKFAEKIKASQVEKYDKITTKTEKKKEKKVAARKTTKTNIEVV